MAGIPVILCGKREDVGAPVIERLKPEFDGTAVVRHSPDAEALTPA